MVRSLDIITAFFLLQGAYGQRHDHDLVSKAGFPSDEGFKPDVANNWDRIGSYIYETKAESNKRFAARSLENHYDATHDRVNDWQDGVKDSLHRIALHLQDLKDWTNENIAQPPLGSPNERLRAIFFRELEQN